MNDNQAERLDFVFFSCPLRRLASIPLDTHRTEWHRTPHASTFEVLLKTFRTKLGINRGRQFLSRIWPPHRDPLMQQEKGHGIHPDLPKILSFTLSAKNPWPLCFRDLWSIVVRIWKRGPGAH